MADEKVRGVIAPVSAAEANRLVAGERYEVVFDHLSGGPDGVTANFRLVEPTATQPFGPGSHVEYSKSGPPTIHTSGLGGSGPEFELPLYELRRVPEIDPVRLAKLLASIISLSRISPRVLGIPDEEGPEYKRVLDYLSGDDAG